MSVEMADIRAALAANLSATITDAQVNAYRMANPTTPSLNVTGFEEITPTVMSRGGYEIGMVIQGLVGKPTEKGAQIRLDKWISPKGATSVWAAIESDPTLGGIVANARVMSCDGSQIVDLDNGTSVLASTWHVTVDL